MVTKAVQSFPQQGLWTVLAVVKSSNKDRALKGQACLSKIQDYNNKVKKDTTEIRRMIVQGQKFSDELLQLCLARVEERASKVTLGRNLGFNHKVAPCRLVVPFQAMLIPSLPVIQDSEHLKGFRPFPRDPTTIEGMLKPSLWFVSKGVLTRSSRSRRGPNPQLSSKTPQDQHSRLRRKDLQCSLQTQR
jgi:serine/threonine-protein kinase ATR